MWDSWPLTLAKQSRVENGVWLEASLVVRGLAGSKGKDSFPSIISHAELTSVWTVSASVGFIGEAFASTPKNEARFVEEALLGRPDLVIWCWWRCFDNSADKTLERWDLGSWSVITISSMTASAMLERSNFSRSRSTAPIFWVARKSY